MSEVIHQETMVFLVSVCHGVLMTFLYDLLRAVRRAFSHNLIVISAEDFLFWMTAGFLTFCLAFLKTDGEIRGYVAAGIGLGAVFYHYSVSTVIVKILSEGLRLLKKLWKFICKWLIKPVRKTLSICKKGIEFARKSGYNLCVKRKKRHGGDLQDDDRHEYKNKRGRRYGKKKKTSKQK